MHKTITEMHWYNSNSPYVAFGLAMLYTRVVSEQSGTVM